MRACRQTETGPLKRERELHVHVLHLLGRAGESNKSLSKSLAEIISFQHWVLPLTAQTAGAVSTA